MTRMPIVTIMGKDIIMETGMAAGRISMAAQEMGADAGKYQWQHLCDCLFLPNNSSMCQWHMLGTAQSEVQAKHGILPVYGDCRVVFDCDNYNRNIVRSR